MADLVLPVDLGSIVGPNCYQNRDADAAKVAAAMTVTIPSVYQSWITQESVPGVDDRDKNWLRLDSNGNPVEALTWSTSAGAWVRWFALNKYAPVSGGAADAYTSTYSPALTSSDIKTGAEFSFIASFTNAGTSTWSPNGLGPYTIKKNATEDLDPGDILTGQIISLHYDGTNMQMVNPVANPALLVANLTPGLARQIVRTVDTPPLESVWANMLNESAEITVPTTNGAAIAPFAHNLGGAPWIVRWVMRAIVTDGNNYPVGYEVDLDKFFLGGGGDTNEAWVTFANATEIGLRRTDGVAGSLQVADYATGAVSAGVTTADWKLVCYFA